MNRPLKNKITFSLFILTLFLIPLISFADNWISLGTTCTFGSAGAPDQKCVFSRPGNGSYTGQKLHLKWEIAGANYHDPVCAVSCSRQGGTTCAGIINKDSNQTATNNLTAYNLKPKDDVLIPDIPDPKNSMQATLGLNTYQVSCYERNGTASNVKTTNRIQVEPTSVSQGPPCEVPFGDVYTNLMNNKLAVITEKNMAGWAATDTQDYFNWPDGIKDKEVVNGRYIFTHYVGSGDREDLKKVFSFNQCYYVNKALSAGLDTNIDIAKISNDLIGIRKQIKSFTDKKYPVNIFYYLSLKMNPPGAISQILPYGAHAVIASDLNDISTFPIIKFKVEVIDSNIAGVETLTCSKQQFSIRNPNGTPGNVYYASFCTSPNISEIGEKIKPDIVKMLKSLNSSQKLIDLINNAEPIAILTSVDDNSVSIGNFEKQMIQSRENICQSNSNLHLCLDTPAKRLLDNIPNIKNGEGDDDHGGYCRAYSDFIERVAYLGDFVGTDYHPNDGKYVGVDCDANHYPLPAKKI